jgi:hypothetical protein
MNLGDGKITLLLSELDLPIVQLLDCARAHASTTLSGAILHICVAHAHRQNLNPEP